MHADDTPLLDQIERDFAFLAREHGFTVTPRKSDGDVYTVEYLHPDAVVRFVVRHGEWYIYVLPTLRQFQAESTDFDKVVEYLTQPPIDVAAAMAQPKLSMSEALTKRARQAEALMARILALVAPARWPEVRDDMQAVLSERGQEEHRQFVEGWRKEEAAKKGYTGLTYGRQV